MINNITPTSPVLRKISMHCFLFTYKNKKYLFIPLMTTSDSDILISSRCGLPPAFQGRGRLFCHSLERILAWPKKLGGAIFLGIMLIIIVDNTCTIEWNIIQYKSNKMSVCLSMCLSRRISLTNGPINHKINLNS